MQLLTEKQRSEVLQLPMQYSLNTIFFLREAYIVEILCKLDVVGE